MGKHEKIPIKLLSGLSDKNIKCDEPRNLLLNFGFDERIKGSHHIFQLIIEEWIETANLIGRPIPTPIGRLLFA
jgi:hypothetical protein